MTLFLKMCMREQTKEYTPHAKVNIVREINNSLLRIYMEDSSYR